MLLDTRDLQLMNAFESLTHASVLDCFEAEDNIVFLVKKGQLGKAIGKGGATITNARKRFGKRIFVFEDSENPKEFIEKACHPVKAASTINDDSIKIDASRSQRDDISGKQIRIIKELVERKLKVDKVDFFFN